MGKFYKFMYFYYFPLLFCISSMMRITADDTTSPQLKVLEMSEKDGFELIGTLFNNSLEAFFESLSVSDQIVINGF
jgi:hypothetical protein